MLILAYGSVQPVCIEISLISPRTLPRVTTTLSGINWLRTWCNMNVEADNLYHSILIDRLAFAFVGNVKIEGSVHSVTACVMPFGKYQAASIFRCTMPGAFRCDTA